MWKRVHGLHANAHAPAKARKRERKDTAKHSTTRHPDAVIHFVFAPDNRVEYGDEGSSGISRFGGRRSNLALPLMLHLRCLRTDSD